MSKIYVIDGYNKISGGFTSEIFKNKKNAVRQFKSYVREYECSINKDDKWYAENDRGEYISLTEQKTMD